MFWERATARGAFAAAIGSALFSLLFKIFLPEVPFMNRVGFVFLLCVAVAVVVSLLHGPKRHPKAIRVADIDFRTSPGFNILGAVVATILTGLYWYWW
jgi:SSS family solute:Na+ symporter